MRSGIELLRAVCLIIVTLFHTVSRYDNPNIITELPYFFNICVRQLIWIAVPMFFFISGFLFDGQIANNRFTWRTLVLDKAKRLLIPYICFTCMIMLSSGFFDYTQILKGGFWHLWFLPTLYCCFLVYFGILNYMNKLKTHKIYELLLYIISFACCCIISIPEKYCILGIDGVAKWGVYFALGAITKSNEKFFINCMNKYKVWIPLLLIWVINNIYDQTPYMTVTWNNTLAVCSILLVLFYFANEIKINTRLNKTILSIAASSMGIYILHYWILIYTTSSTSLKIMGLFEYRSQIYVICMLVIITIITIVLSYIITTILKSNRFLRMVIG